MFVRTQLQEGIRDGALLVPQRGITRDVAGQATALVIGADSKAELRKVTVDRTIGDRWLVDAGLKPGDRVIINGLTNLQPGTPVKAVPAGVAPVSPVPGAPATAAPEPGAAADAPATK